MRLGAGNGLPPNRPRAINWAWYLSLILDLIGMNVHCVRIEVFFAFNPKAEFRWYPILDNKDND